MSNDKAVAAEAPRQAVVIERVYRATIDELWALWTTKDGFESWWGPEEFRVEVLTFEARQVEESELCGRDLDDPRPGGLGLHIIREVMDEVCYQKRSPKGMRLTMTKRAPAGGGRGE